MGGASREMLVEQPPGEVALQTGGKRDVNLARLDGQQDLVRRVGIALRAWTAAGTVDEQDLATREALQRAVEISSLVNRLERHAEQRGVDGELLDRSRTVRIEREQADLFSLEDAGMRGQLRDRGGLPGTGGSDDREDVG